MNEKLDEKRLVTKTIYEGKIIRVKEDLVELPNGKETTREVVQHPGAVGMLAVQDGQIFLVRQYRYALQQETLEIPAGKIDRGEDPEICAIRELREEIGYTGKMKYMGTFHTSPGFADEIIHLYQADELQWSPLSSDEDEFLGVIKVPLAEAVDMVMNNELKDAKTVLAILWANRLFAIPAGAEYLEK
ncbi:NUDIX hydrolase [Syntrophobotulus glycolicus DSM 8271]|uniref:NUDIX hydrolase n=1 Tax=Syntrophobotulus glycolicus (strain DSM 8271 / FlGlyR) TaxID=645991 RepID=F0T083_SYNGF|nr:NUDIX hydrolase [Syntrophobotulus glycolicus]ADY56170.1 NUDIX hydrolase [Syntrophobotulus glycolicus DSM 8271]